MKRYISAALTIAQLKEQFGQGMKDPQFNRIIELDPTSNIEQGKGGKYCPWLFRQEARGNLTPDTYQTVTDTLSDLANPTRSRAYAEKDINRYKTVQDLIDAHIAAQDAEVELSDRQQQRNAHKRAKEAERKRLEGEDTGDITELVSDGEWTVYKPNTWEGAIALAYVGVDKSKPFGPGNESNLKARWCTAGESDDHWYRHYTGMGDLYVFINEKDPINKFQSCPGSRSWWFDKNDREYGKQAFLNFMSEHPVIGDFFKVRTVGGVQVMGTTIEGYDPNATEISIPDGVTSFPNFRFPDSCEKVILPDSITVITSDAFAKSHVKTVIYNAVTRIERNAFKDSAIEDINLEPIEFIGSSAFRNCQNLTGVTLSSDATIQAYGFANCNLHGTITQYPETTISAGTYDNNPELTVVWEDADVKYPFTGIKELVLKKGEFPLMEAANQGRVPIRYV